MANDQPAVSSRCKKTRRVLRNVHMQDGQHLHYFVTVDGATPVFSLSCRHKTHFSADDLGPPVKNYEKIWQKSDADEEAGQDGESYAFTTAFAAALKYTLRVELHDAAHTRVGDGVIVDADYESDNPLVSCNEAFVIRTKP